MKVKLQELGFASLKEAQEALRNLESDIQAKEAELEETLSYLESSTVEAPAPAKTEYEVIPTSIDDL